MGRELARCTGVSSFGARTRRAPKSYSPETPPRGRPPEAAKATSTSGPAPGLARAGALGGHADALKGHLDAQAVRARAGRPPPRSAAVTPRRAAELSTARTEAVIMFEWMPTPKRVPAAPGRAASMMASAEASAPPPSERSS